MIRLTIVASCLLMALGTAVQAASCSPYFYKIMPPSSPVGEGSRSKGEFIRGTGAAIYQLFADLTSPTSAAGEFSFSFTGQFSGATDLCGYEQDDILGITATKNLLTGEMTTTAVVRKAYTGGMPGEILNEYSGRFFLPRIPAYGVRNHSDGTVGYSVQSDLLLSFGPFVSTSDNSVLFPSGFRFVGCVDAEEPSLTSTFGLKYPVLCGGDADYTYGGKPGGFANFPGAIIAAPVPPGIALLLPAVGLLLLIKRSSSGVV